MQQVTSPAGRFATARFGETTARLLLAKNPAGWAEALPLAQTETVVLAIDSAAADGRDVSWLWDVDYEQLAGRTVIATGPRAQDLAVRLGYAEVEHRCIPDLAAALGRASPSRWTSSPPTRRSNGCERWLVFDVSPPEHGDGSRSCLVYQSLLGIYGDRGNAQVAAKRLAWRGYDPVLTVVEPGDALPDTGAGLPARRR